LEALDTYIRKSPIFAKSTAQKRPQNSRASFAHRRICGLKSALRRSCGDYAEQMHGILPAARLRKPISSGKEPAARWPAEQDHALKAD
jgi:hypothetical protein